MSTRKKKQRPFKAFQILGRFLRSRFRGYIFDPIVSRLSWNTTWPSRLGRLFLSPQGLSFFHFFFLFFFFAADLPISFNRDALASVNEVGANRLPTLSPLCLLVLSTPLSSLSSILSLTSPLFFPFRSSRTQSVSLGVGSQSTLIPVSYDVDGFEYVRVWTKSLIFTHTYWSRIFRLYPVTFGHVVSVRNWSEQIGTDRGHS